jgi:RimJ/RimL family protein N-acetyltransferase
MYLYKDLGFRPIEKDDLVTIKEQHNDISALLELGNVEMYNNSQQETWFEKISKDSVNKRFAIVLQSSEELIGIIRINNLNTVNGNCEIGLDIFSGHRRKGYGTRTYEMLMHYLFLNYNMHMVYLRVGEFNKIAVSMYKKIGFRKTGYYEDYLYRHGKYWNYIIMSMKKDDYVSKYDGYQ